MFVYFVTKASGHLSYATKSPAYALVIFASLLSSAKKTSKDVVFLKKHVISLIEFSGILELFYVNLTNCVKFCKLREK